MRKATYLGVFEPSKDGGYGVYFPDLPGCTSVGITLEDAQLQATDALGLHLYGMEKDGEQIPMPSETPDIDHETCTGFFVSPVSVFPDMVRMELDTRATKTNVTLPAWMKEMAESQNVNFSRVLQAALLEVLGASATIASQNVLTAPEKKKKSSTLTNAY